MASSKATTENVRFEINLRCYDNWYILPTAVQTNIIGAATDGSASVDMEFDDEKFQLDVSKMTAKRCTDNFLCPLRCTVPDSRGDYFSWSYKDDKNEWRSYNMTECISLEEAYVSGEHVKSLDIAGKSYSINLRRMIQDSAETGFRRKISRLKSKAVEKPVKAEPAEETSAVEESLPLKSAASSGNSNMAKSMMRTVKGRPPIDPEAAPALANVRCNVYVEAATGDIYDVLLNQTNLAQNNNKYYIIQLIEADGTKQYWCWTRWGRVGYKGQNNLDACGTDLEKARKLFENKFLQKTNNNWADRKQFVKYNGKYDLIERDFGADSKDSDDDEEETENEEIVAPKSGTKRKGSVSRDNAKKQHLESKVDSKLDRRLQSLLEMICDIKDMEEVVVSMNYDVQKAPLGKLTAAQLKAGYTALQKIAEIIESKDSEKPRQVSSSRKVSSGSGLSSSARQALMDACNEFYTRVPHCFGMRQPPLIANHVELKSKLELLETLGDIEIAIHSMKEETAIAEPEHPLDKHYRNLKCSMVPVEASSEEFSLIDRYLHDTHGQTHNTYKMELMEVFAVDRHDEAANFRADIGNNMLLWHGSRLTNYYGIISQGLRIAPPEAPVTGYMFGKGVYFADCASKSANYCQTSALRDVGFLLLCKVAIGKPNELMVADYKADKLSSGYNSVKGLGKYIPDEKTYVKLADGTVVPAGRLVPNPSPNSSRFALLYNEFVVYDTQQIAMKYICKVKFNFSI